MTVNPELIKLESEVPTCGLYSDCSRHAGQQIELSNIAAGDPRRGTHDARILIVTEAPDSKSAMGVAYRGGTGTRIMRMFLRPEYGICLDYEDYGREGIPAFLRDMRIYQTSCVKCVLHGDPSTVGERVLVNCRRKFLDVQITQLPEVELILPMGRLAISSVLHRSLRRLDYESIVGRFGRGIVAVDASYGKMIVALPHPSGANRAFNPPVLRTGDSPGTIRSKRAFARALAAIRSRLGTMGYRLRELHPSSQVGPLDKF